MSKNMNLFLNMLFRNRELDRAFTFISKADFDIFCLQEVPEEFLKRLQTLPCSIAYRSDVERLFAHDIERNFIVILSKHPITAQGEIPFPDYWHLLPLRTRIFVRLMWPFYFSKIRNRGGLYADIPMKGYVGAYLQSPPHTRTARVALEGIRARDGGARLFCTNHRVRRLQHNRSASYFNIELASRR